MVSIFKLNVLMTESPVANLISDHDYSVFIMKKCFYPEDVFAYPLSCLHVPAGICEPRLKTNGVHIYTLASDSSNKCKRGQ
jgi:hypothetical protein